jgi:hypothetical protein
MSDKIQIDDGGPAFPLGASNIVHDMASELSNDEPAGPDRNKKYYQLYRQLAMGMTLRDWFAGQALQGMLAEDADDITCTELADASYRCADAMIAARKGENK